MEEFNFKNYDLKSISLLVTLFKAPKNGVRDLQVRHFIKNKLLTPNNMRKLFRPFKCNESGDVIIHTDYNETESIRSLCSSVRSSENKKV